MISYYSNNKDVTDQKERCIYIITALLYLTLEEIYRIKSFSK
jgi:hypothetical protein